MNQTYLNKLEYNQILERLKTYCHTYIGKELAGNLKPSNQKEEVKINLAMPNEAVSLIERNSTPPISEIDDIFVYLKLLESSSTISEKALLSVVNILEMADELIEYFSSFANTEDFPNLKEYFANLYTNHSIIDKIKKCVIDENTIADNSSNALASIRRRERRFVLLFHHFLQDFLLLFLHLVLFLLFLLLLLCIFLRFLHYLLY